MFFHRVHNGCTTNGLRKEVSSFGAHDDGIADIDSAIDIDVVLEVGVIQSDAGIITHQHGVAHVNSPVYVYVAIQETHVEAGRLHGVVGAGDVVCVHRHDLLIGDPAQTDSRSVAAVSDITD